MKQTQADLVRTLNQLASAYIEASRYTEALPHLEKALSLATDPASVLRFATLSNLGSVYRFLDDLPKAIECTEEALAVINHGQDDTPPSRLARVKVLCNLGALHRLSHNFGQAESLLQEALDICRDLPQITDTDLSNAHFSLALLYKDRSDYLSATPHFEQALALTGRSSPGRTSKEYAVQLQAFGDLKRNTGDLATAVRLHEEASLIYKQSYGETHFNYGSSLVSLARLYRDMNWRIKAVETQRQAVAIFEASVGQNHQAYIRCQRGLGALLAEMGAFEEAGEIIIGTVDLSRRAYGEKSPIYAECLHDLTMLLPNLPAERINRIWAEFIQLDALQPTIKETMGRLLDLTSKGPRPLQLFFLEKIAAIERSAGLKHDPSYAQTLVNLGRTYRMQGDLEKAEACLQEALEIERQFAQYQRPELSIYLNTLAGLWAATGRAEMALTLMQEANRLDSHMVGQVFATGSEQQRLQYFVVLRQQFHVFLALVVRHLVTSATAIQAAFDLTLRRKGLGAEVLAVQRDAILSGKYPRLAPQLAEWRALRTRIAQKTLAGPGSEDPTRHQDQLNAWSERREAIESALAQQIPEMNLYQQLQQADWRAVAKRLSPDTRLVEFVLIADFDFSISASPSPWQGARYLAFVLSSAPSANVTLVDLGAAHPIDQLVAQFRTSITNGEMGRGLFWGDVSNLEKSAQSDVAGQALRERLFDPLLPALAGVKRIFLATDGDLTRLPFETLPRNESGFLIDDYAFSYLNSGRDMLRWGQSLPNRPAKAAVVADPDFDLNLDKVSTSEKPATDDQLSRDFQQATLSFTRLHGTRQEGEMVAQLLKVSPLLAQTALEQRVKELVSPLILHIATHGFFLSNQEIEPQAVEPSFVNFPTGEAAARGVTFFDYKIENPLLRSGLALAGANRTLNGTGGLPPEAEDGILTAEDITAMDLSSTELVVLSACETGLGDVLVGEGVYGLQRAISIAGTKTLVMSLWKVPDRQTQELMVYFYQRLLAGVPRAEALRQAQLALKQKYPAPLYWGAFICQGDPGPLEG